MGAKDGEDLWLVYICGAAELSSEVHCILLNRGLLTLSWHAFSSDSIKEQSDYWLSANHQWEANGKL